MLTEKQNGGTVNRYQRGAGGELLSRPGWGAGAETPQMDGLGSMRQGINMNNGVFTGQADYSAFRGYKNKFNEKNYQKVIHQCTKATQC